ncbi:NepR family anti-sigma factor [Hyphomonas sp.]|uniref:NepR family anti-sigma factor n=1 Tax=Hyphomonas sp. TaxID=87 RepID=UPI001BCAB613|nr:NepR family anti-sigma factor [Hyphomonas sp.]
MGDAGKLNGKDPDGRGGQRRLGNRAIGERLRQMYDGVVGESVPDDFFKLLEQAEAKARSGNTSQTDGEA